MGPTKDVKEQIKTTPNFRVWENAVSGISSHGLSKQLYDLFAIHRSSDPKPALESTEMGGRQLVFLGCVYCNVAQLKISRRS